MNLEYYLFCKKEYENIIFYLDEIINNLTNLNNENLNNISLKNSDLIYLKDNLDINNKIIKSFEEKKKQIKELKTQTQFYISNLCNHEFTNDYIDINPDKSIKIIYCPKCETLKSI